MDPETKRLKEETSAPSRRRRAFRPHEIALALNSTMAPEDINQLIVGKCVKRLGVEQEASICLVRRTRNRRKLWSE